MFETVKPTNKNNNKVFRFTAKVILISGIAKMAEASAYTPTKKPTCASAIAKPSVICGRIPEGTSSDKIPIKVTLAIRENKNQVA